jgi:hypothetical protein
MTKLYCPKCSHYGKPEKYFMTLRGFGNKMATRCVKCHHVFYFEDYIAPDPTLIQPEKEK